MARRTCRYSGTVREQIAAAFRRRLQFRDNRQGLDVAPAVLASFAIERAHPVRPTVTPTRSSTWGRG